MLIARVTDHIVASAKSQSYVGHKILRLLPESWNGSSLPAAAPIVALDLVDAGIGDRVLVCQEGRWARETLGDLKAPVRSMVVAIVDQVLVHGSTPPSPSR